MTTSLLQAMLSAGSVDLGDDDTRFEKVAQACAAMASHLQESPRDIGPAVLVGLDREGSETEPMFERAEQVLLEHWKMLRVKFPERPRQLLRAILFDACHQAGRASEPLACIVWLSAADILPWISLPERESQVIGAALRELATVTERYSLKTAAPKSLPRLPPVPAIESVAIPDVQLDKDAIQKRVERAPGPSNRSGQVKGANQHWPQNQPNEWSSEFASHMTKALHDTTQEGMAAVLGQFQTILQKDRETLSAFLSEHGAALAQLVEVPESRQHTERQKLAALWWSEALYSSSLRESYRRLPLEVAAVAMAFDLHAQVDTPAPASVAHLLAETVLRLDATQRRTVPLQDILAVLREKGAPLRELVSREQLPPGRVSLLAVVEQVVLGNAEIASDVGQRTGILPDVTMDIPSFAMACFRNLQARALVEEAS